MGGLQKCIEIDDDRKLLPFFEKRMAAEVPADSLGDEFKGYVFQISGGNDKQGFPMMQGVLTNQRVRLLFSKGMKTYRPRREGTREAKKDWTARVAQFDADRKAKRAAEVAKKKEVEDDELAQSLSLWVSLVAGRIRVP